MRPQLLVAMRCDRTHILRDELRVGPDRDPSRERYLAGNLTTPRTLVHFEAARRRRPAIRLPLAIRSQTATLDRSFAATSETQHPAGRA